MLLDNPVNLHGSSTSKQKNGRIKANKIKNQSLNKIFKLCDFYAKKIHKYR